MPVPKEGKCLLSLGKLSDEFLPPPPSHLLAIFLNAQFLEKPLMSNCSEGVLETCIGSISWIALFS